MSEPTTTTVSFPSSPGADALTPILREGAQRLLATAIEEPLPSKSKSSSTSIRTGRIVDEKGHRQVVRNGYLPERTIQTGVGPVDVRRPRVHDRRPEDARTARWGTPNGRREIPVQTGVPSGSIASGFIAPNSSVRQLGFSERATAARIGLKGWHAPQQPTYMLSESERRRIGQGGRSMKTQ